MKTPSILKALQNIRLKMQSGQSVTRSIDLSVSNANTPFLRALKVWKARMDLGQDSAVIISGIPELGNSSGRRAFIIILENGLKGTPIDEFLAELEKEFYGMAELSYEKHLQVLPLKMIMPLILLILPGVMLLLIAPLLFSVGQGF